MRRILAGCALVSIMAAVMATAPPAGGVAGFGDALPDRFYTDAVQWMVDENITTGTTPTCFSPHDPVTRGQAAAFMWRMEGEPDPGPAHGFDDVVAAWQQDPVSWMANTGITTGTSATTYSPEERLTRGQLAALLHRLAGEPEAPPPVAFPDVVRDWQVTPVGWMVQEGITTGTSPSTFSPEDTVTRGQLATFFHRFEESPAVMIDEASPRCERVGPFVGVWNSMDPLPPDGDGSSVTIVIDSFGNFFLFDDFATFCVNQGLGESPATVTATGTQTSPTTLSLDGVVITCLPDGQAPQEFPPAGGEIWTHDPASDTLVYGNGVCSWRAGSSAADCP